MSRNENLRCKYCGWVHATDAPHHRSELAAPTGSGLKFCMLAHGDVERENVLYVFNTAAEREKRTIELIYGNANLSGVLAKIWVAEKNVLEKDGELNFEGDPGLRWFVALMS